MKIIDKAIIAMALISLGFMLGIISLHEYVKVTVSAKGDYVVIYRQHVYKLEELK